MWTLDPLSLKAEIRTAMDMEGGRSIETEVTMRAEHEQGINNFKSWGHLFCARLRMTTDKAIWGLFKF